MRRLRILLVAPSAPYPPNWGFGIRVFNLLKELAENHDVSLACYATGDDADSLAVLRTICRSVDTVPSPVQGLRSKRSLQLRSLLSRDSFQQAGMVSAEMVGLVERLTADGAFDLIQLESSQLAAVVPGGATPVVLDEHNVEFELLRRMVGVERSPVRKAYNWLEYRKFRREEIAAWARADACVMTSDREREIVRAVLPSKLVHVAPNGVDVGYFVPSEVAVDPDEIVYTGLMSYRPNIDAVKFFVRDVMPAVLAARPTAHFTIVGLGAEIHVGSLAGPHVSVVSDVPDMRPYIARASVVVVPLRMGSGTRLKVLEGLAMAKAMVSTNVGCEGIAVRDGDQLLIEDEPTRFAAAVVRLMADADERSRLGAAGRALVESQYSWSSITRGLSDLYAQVLAANA